MAFRSPRSIDHCVLPTADLEVARRRLGELGFTVAPDGSHPFGTRNCCVYLSDGTFLEPLAIADQTKAQIAAMRGNVFVARDAAWRYRWGEEGFSALVFGSADAARDHDEFSRAGISAGPRLSFARPFVDGSGRRDKASFELAFAADLRAPDAFFFTCERVNAPAVDRAALQQHANGATRIKAIVMEASRPADFSAFLQELVCVRAEDHPGGIRFGAANGEVVVVAGRVEDRRPRQGLILRRIVFGVSDLAQTRSLFERQGIAPTDHESALSVPPAPGQGAEFIFEE